MLEPKDQVKEQPTYGSVPGGSTRSLIACIAMSVLSGSAVSSFAIENLDRYTNPPPSHELLMTAGRLNKVPVSWAWDGQFTHTSGLLAGGSIVHVRARCVEENVEDDICDPGLLVVATDVNGQILAVTYNNDFPLVDGSHKYDSYVRIPQPANVTMVYKVVAYSHHRGTSRVHIQWDYSTTFDVPDWNDNPFVDPLNPIVRKQNMNQPVGGALVRLGPVIPGEQFSVRTADNGLNSGTRIWLFNPISQAFAFQDGAMTGDRDPRYVFTDRWICDKACADRFDTLRAGSKAQFSSFTYAIVGKDLLSSEAVEIWVDLVKTNPSKAPNSEETFVNFNFPLGTCSGSLLRPDCASSTSALLAPGTYYFSVFIKAGAGVGHLPASDGTNHPASETGDNFNCVVPEFSFPPSYSVERGQGNDLALKVLLIEDNKVIRIRALPRGALGAELPLQNRITIEHTVPDDGRPHQYAIHLSQVAVGVFVDGRWSFRRNPEQVELKVATLNVEYDPPDSMQRKEEMQNAADLLGGGPIYRGVEIFYGKSSKWRWEADILNFNEILSGRGKWMQDRLTFRTGIPWSLVENTSKEPPLGIGPTRYGPILLNQFSRLSQISGVFPTSANSLSQLELISGSVVSKLGTYYTVPANGALRSISDSPGFQERPVSVFHLYLPHEDYAIGLRDMATTQLMNHMTNLLRKDPASFNTGRLPDPKHPGNRMIILGDSNMKNSQCSEVNAMLRKMRETFGYAVDVSMAITDRSDRTFDMHNSGAPITDLLTGSYVSCNDPSLARPLITNLIKPAKAGCTYHYMHPSRWDQMCPTSSSCDARRWDTSELQWFPWWAGTSSKNGGGGSRHDIIILVGLGWADDDPVQEYLVTANSPVPNVMNGLEDNGVEIRHFCLDADSPKILNPGNQSNYVPENNVCPNGDILTFRTDHKPVGIRLRSQMNR